MSLIEDELSSLIGRNIVVIMNDKKKFRGTLVNHDSKLLIMEDVLELSDKFQWVKPVIYTAVAKNVADNQDVIEQSDRGYLNRVLINTRHIVRIWPWEPKKIE